MADRIDDMELMKKILLFTRKNRPGMGPGPCRPPMPAFGEHHPHDEMPPFGPHGHHGPHGPHDPGFKKPPLSREHLLVIIGENPEGIRQKAIMEKAGIGQSSASELITRFFRNLRCAQSLAQPRKNDITSFREQSKVAGLPYVSRVSGHWRCLQL